MKINIKKINSFLLSIAYIINPYHLTFLPVIPIVYLMFSLMCFYFIVYSFNNKIKINIKPLLLTLLLLLLNFIICLLPINYDIFSKNAILSIIKLTVWGVYLSFFTEFIDKRFFIKCLIIISLISTLYLYIQSIFGYVFSIKLPSVFNLGIIKTSSGGINSNSFDRPSSFFSEPAFYANYTLITLAFLLLNKYKIKFKKFISLLLAIGIILSSSTAGLILLILLFLIYIIYLYKEINIRKKIIIIAFLIISSVILLNLNDILIHFGTLGQKIASSLNKLDRLSNSARVGRSFEYLNNLHGLELIVGNGIGNEYIIFEGVANYMNAATRLILNSGIIGAAFVIIYIIDSFFTNKNIFQKFIIIVIIIKCLIGNMLFSMAGIFSFSIIYLTNKNMEGIE